jgi:anti-sigma factor RsiW
MRCEELREWLSAELDGEARSIKRAAVCEHLAACPACRRAQAAAETLRQGLWQAAWAPPNEGRDEALLAVLRQEGLCGEAAGVAPQRHEVRVGGWREALHSFCFSVFRLGGSTTSFRPAAAALVVSFLLTWSSLRWAETGRAVGPDIPGMRSATAPARPPDAAMLDEWMAGAPTLGALSRLQWLPRARQAPPGPIQRGSMHHESRRVG